MIKSPSLEPGGLCILGMDGTAGSLHLDFRRLAPDNAQSSSAWRPG